jgi:hypothetical protein
VYTGGMSFTLDTPGKPASTQPLAKAIHPLIRCVVLTWGERQVVLGDPVGVFNKCRHQRVVGCSGHHFSRNTENRAKHSQSVRPHWNVRRMEPPGASRSVSLRA